MKINLTRRRRDILNLILNAEEYITGNELARICNVSVRTIRSDIKEINAQLK
ncbi:helix-turn-helix domain-containing protein [Clostridium sp. YIM B02555]|uniref:helix-turn-helix domain-containing protein n=1 Tax=Clostridium sp. YIM B02555 TaxID=2911968 RepID=UPI001EEDDDA0